MIAPRRGIFNKLEVRDDDADCFLYLVVRIRVPDLACYQPGLVEGYPLEKRRRFEQLYLDVDDFTALCFREALIKSNLISASLYNCSFHYAITG